MPIGKNFTLLRRFSAVVFLIGLSRVVCATTVQESLQYISVSKDYVEITASAGMVVDLRYATPNNFVGYNMYGEFNRAFLHRIAAKKLEKAVRTLKSTKPRYKLVIFDALRPRSVQYMLWSKVRGTIQERYVANPKGGSIHNFGFALDLSITDEYGKELDMGTPFDDFTPLAEPRLEQEFLKKGKLTDLQIKNRRLLRNVMEQSGFIALPLEWWHFDALPAAEVRMRYRIVE
jgi:D-alanyl-D-alanine dipeptidase